MEVIYDLPASNSRVVVVSSVPIAFIDEIVLGPVIVIVDPTERVNMPLPLLIVVVPSPQFIVAPELTCITSVLGVPNIPGAFSPNTSLNVPEGVGAAAASGIREFDNPNLRFFICLVKRKYKRNLNI